MTAARVKRALRAVASAERAESSTRFFKTGRGEYGDGDRFIEAKDALAIAELLLDDEEDLIHKASGWMLREVGQRVGLRYLRQFLKQHASVMPRTMLRYSIEKLPPKERAKWRAAS